MSSCLTRRRWLALAAALPAAIRAAEPRPKLAITMDDVDWSAIPEPFRAQANRNILDALHHHGNLRAALFVTGKNVDSPQGHSILQSWSDRGHMLANHTWSHRAYNNSIEPAEFGQDVLRCEALLRAYAGFRPYFRFPQLKEGATRQRRDWMRAFLSAHGYRNGAVTIDASDWYYDRRLRARLEQAPRFDVTLFRQPYLDHIWDRANYYSGLARQVLGGPIPHTLLIHFNLLNALFLGDLLRMFRAKGWDTIHAQAAYRHEVFRRQPDIVPAGESLVWALAKETGRFESQLRFPGEDDVYEKPLLDRLKL